MNWNVFRDSKKQFSVVLFIEENDLVSKRPDLEDLGRQRNVKLVIQPCPFEGIEFLYRIEDDLIGHHVSMEKDVFWQAIQLKADVPPKVLMEISEHHHQYLCAFLEQDAKKVAKEGRALESFSEYFG